MYTIVVIDHVFLFLTHNTVFECKLAQRVILCCQVISKPYFLQHLLLHALVLKEIQSVKVFEFEDLLCFLGYIFLAVV